MNVRHLEKFTLCLVLAAMLFSSGCTTVLIRSEPDDKPEYAFPATATDAKLLWMVGIRGAPLIASNDPAQQNRKSSAGVRLMLGVGSFVDLPFSIAGDTIFLPADLIRLKRAAGKTPDQNTQLGGLAKPAPTDKR